MRGNAENLIHLSKHKRYPEPDAEDLACLLQIQTRDPERRIPGPCYERLRFAGMITTNESHAKGREIIVTEVGRAALAEAT